MSKKISSADNVTTQSDPRDITGTTYESTNKRYLDVASIKSGGLAINPLAKYVEATYSSLDMVVTYRWYESSSKVTLYNTITVTYTVAQDTTFTSAAWT